MRRVRHLATFVVCCLLFAACSPAAPDGAWLCGEEIGTAPDPDHPGVTSTPVPTLLPGVPTTAPTGTP